MVLSLLVALTATPALLGTQESIRQGQAKEKREEHRARRCSLVATCVKPSVHRAELDGRPIVLRDGKLYIDTSTASNGEPSGHPYAGYYLPYPDAAYEGLVSTITPLAPILNWIYIDATTHEARYGVRAAADAHLTGPFDCTRQDRRLTFEGWEGWVAVQEAAGVWALRFDRDDDGLAGKVPPGTRVLEVELWRREIRWKKEATARQDDQTTVRTTTAAAAETEGSGTMANGEDKTASVASLSSGEKEVEQDPVQSGDLQHPSVSVGDDAGVEPDAEPDNPVSESEAQHPVHQWGSLPIRSGTDDKTPSSDPARQEPSRTQSDAGSEVETCVDSTRARSDGAASDAPSGDDASSPLEGSGLVLEMVDLDGKR